jgi:hypothetical protein
MTRIVTAPFNGVATPGPVSVPEAQIGDLVLFVIDTANGIAGALQVAPGNGDGWAPAVIVAGELLQSFNGGNTITYQAILERESVGAPHTLSLTGMIS